MKRIRDCLSAPVIPEAKLILVAMTAGRLKEATTNELVDLLEETIGVVSYGAESLRVARINVSSEGHRVVLAPEWSPALLQAEVADA